MAQQEDKTKKWAGEKERNKRDVRRPCWENVSHGSVVDMATGWTTEGSEFESR
jgi:hypothetical protein